MPTAQINARIDASLKTSGDRMLSEAGYTPTRAIRALWGYVANNRHDRAAVKALFDLLEGKDRSREIEQKANDRARRAEEGPLIFERALSEMGLSIDVFSKTAAMTDGDMLERAYADKLAERGLSE